MRDRELALQIARCPEMMRALSGEDSPCRQVVAYQHGVFGIPCDAHQLAEPWNGNLTQAPLLFLASNPSIDPAETYPTLDPEAWPDDRVAAFFRHRFTLAGGAPGLDPIPQGPPSRYWRCIHRRAAEVLRSAPEAIRPGEDYALTEVVRCKSKREVGVEAALATCASRYLDDTLRLSSAAIVVVLGIKAVERLRSVLPDLADLHLGSFVRDIELGGRIRSVLALGHPSWPGRPTVLAHLAPEVRAAVFKSTADLVG
jgi:hypothetical protein